MYSGWIGETKPLRTSILCVCLCMSPAQDVYLHMPLEIRFVANGLVALYFGYF